MSTAIALLRRCGVALAASVVLASVLLGSAPAASATAARAAGPLQALPVGANQTYAVPYFAWNGRPRTAVVVLPRDYVPGAADEALPCIVEARGRNYAPASHARCWRDLPTTRRFIVICADSSGRRDPSNSWGVAGQIDDLAELPAVIEASIPWVKIDRQRLYVAGPSMGGTETLMALALHPDVFAAGLCVDGVADLAARYREFGLVDRLDDRLLMRTEIGCRPSRMPFRYAVAESPQLRRYTRPVRGAAGDLVERRRHAGDQPGDHPDGEAVRAHPCTVAGLPGHPADRDRAPQRHVADRSRRRRGLPLPGRSVAHAGGRSAGEVGFRESRPLTHVWGYTVTAPRGLTRFYRLFVNGDVLTVDCAGAPHGLRALRRCGARERGAQRLADDGGPSRRRRFCHRPGRPVDRSRRPVRPGQGTATG